MHLSQLLEKSATAIADWLVADAHASPEFQETQRLRREALDAARAGELTDDEITRWANANDVAGEQLLAEGEELKRYVKHRRTHAS